MGTNSAAKWRRPAILFLCLGAAATGSRAATILTNNLSAASSGSDAVSGNLLLGADFSTGSSSYSLDSVTLLLKNDTAGAASLYLYSDNGGLPGSVLATLTSPASYSANLAATTFTAAGITLSAGKTYWLVLGALSGSFEWSWTSTNFGEGAGYAGDSAYFDGTYWFGTSAVYPYQVSVTANAVSDSVTPEPASLGLLFAGLLGVACLAGRNSFSGKHFQEKTDDRTY